MADKKSRMSDMHKIEGKIVSKSPYTKTIQLKYATDGLDKFIDLDAKKVWLFLQFHHLSKDDQIKIIYRDAETMPEIIRITKLIKRFLGRGKANAES